MVVALVGTTAYDGLSPHAVVAKHRPPGVAIATVGLACSMLLMGLCSCSAPGA